MDDNQVTLTVDRHFTDGILKGIVKRDDMIGCFTTHESAMEWVRAINGKHVRGRLEYFVDNWRITSSTTAEIILDGLGWL